MPLDFKHTEAVASGRHEQIQKWSRILKKAGIDFEVIDCCSDNLPQSDYAELWVDQSNCEEARAALQASDGKMRMW